MKIEIELKSINEVSFRSRRDNHSMVVFGSIENHQIEKIMNQQWEYEGIEFFKKYFAAEGYDLKPISAESGG